MAGIYTEIGEDKSKVSVSKAQAEKWKQKIKDQPEITK